MFDYSDEVKKAWVRARAGRSRFPPLIANATVTTDGAHPRVAGLPGLTRLLRASGSQVGSRGSRRSEARYAHRHPSRLVRLFRRAKEWALYVKRAVVIQKHRF